MPKYVIKSGVVLVEDGEIRHDYLGKTLHVAPSYDPGIEPHIAEWFEQCYSIRFRNYPVDSSYLHKSEQVSCEKK